MNEKEFGQKLKPWLDRSAADGRGDAGHAAEGGAPAGPGRHREPVRLLGAGHGQRRHGPDAPVLGAAARPAFRARSSSCSRSLALKSTGHEVDVGELDAQLLTQELPTGRFLDQDFARGSASPQG